MHTDGGRACVPARPARAPFFAGLRSLHAVLAATLLLVAPLARAQVSALGRLEPYQGSLRITAPSTADNTGGVVLERLLVDRGDDVKAGQVLAVTEAAALMQAQVDQARAEREYRRRLATAARSEGTSACVRARVAGSMSQRRQDLLARKLSSREDAERAKGDADAGTADCAAARATADAAAGAVSLADAQLRRALAAQARAVVRAPVAGRVLDVHARPGELIGPDGILELGRVDRMYAIAEVYETEISQVRVGQPAIVTSRAIGRKLTGRVERIRQQVRKLDQIGTDPAARKDARIIEVEVRLDDPAAAAALSNLQVEVVIGRRSAR
jgi:HlyD family secretion protein